MGPASGKMRVRSTVIIYLHQHLLHWCAGTLTSTAVPQWHALRHFTTQSTGGLGGARRFRVFWKALDCRSGAEK